MSDGPPATSRIATIVYATLTLLAVSVAATAKGYVDSLGEFAFLVLISAVGLALAHFWSHALAHRLASPTGVSREMLREELYSSSLMLLPGVIMVVLSLVASLFTDPESAITIGMVGLLVLLFIYTWVGASQRQVGRMSSFYWGLGTAAVGALMVIFKVLA